MALYEPTERAQPDTSDFEEEEEPAPSVGVLTGYTARIPVVKAFTPLEVQVTPQAGSDWTFSYDWIVNDKHIEDLDTSILPGNYTQPRSLIRCHVHVKASGQDEPIGTLRSNNIIVSPAAPIIEPAMIPEDITLPGLFSMALKARDPNEPENTSNRTLSYFLEDPESENIIVNRETGEVRWTIDADTLQRLAPKLTIRFRVESSWGTSTSFSVDIPLNKEEQSPAEPEPLQEPEQE